MSGAAGGRGRRVAAGAALAAAAACAVAAAWGGGGPAAAARADAPAPLRIVALGDSYTAGNGAGGYVVPDRGCHRSDAAYPGLLARLLRARGLPAEAVNVACSGAVVADVSQPQQRGGDPLAAQLDQIPDAVAAEAGLVVLTVGGNDLRFVDTVRCLVGLPPAVGCAAVAAAADAALPGVATATAATLRAVAARLPGAAVVLVGYPLLVSPACPGSGAFGRAVEARQLRVGRAQAAAVAAARQALPGRDVRFVPTAAAFRGHGPCAGDSTAWVHGLLLAPAFAAFHPNPRGHAATARLLLPAALAAAARDPAVARG